MANAIYTSGLDYLLKNGGWKASGGDTYKAILIDTADYTFSAAHDFLDDVIAGGRVAVGTLTLIDPSGGKLDASDITWTSVTGDVSEAIIVYRHTGTESTSNLLLYLDTVTSGLPVTPNGADITVEWDNTNGLIKIA